VCTGGGVCGGDIRNGSEPVSTRDSFLGRVLKYSGTEAVVANSEEVAGVEDNGVSKVGVGAGDSFPFRRFTILRVVFLRLGVPSDIVLPF